MKLPVPRGWTNGEYVWTHVPKVASNSLTVALREYGWRHEQPLTEHTPGEHFAIVRDPFDRYVSGTLEYWRTQGGMQKEEARGGNLERWLANEVKRGPRIKDMHTSPQINFHRFVTHFIPLDDRLDERLTDYLGISIELERRNPGVSEDIARFKELLGDDGRERVLAFYADDYELWLQALSTDRPG